MNGLCLAASLVLLGVFYPKLVALFVLVVAGVITGILLLLWIVAGLCKALTGN